MGWSVFAIGIWLGAGFVVMHKARPEAPHWLRIAFMIAGIPLLGGVTWLHGPMIGLLGLALGAVLVTWQMWPRLGR